MIVMKIFIPQLIALLSTGMLAGAFIYGLLNVVPTFYEVPVSVHLAYRRQLMGHNSITMQSLMMAAIIAPLWYAAVAGLSRSAWLLAIGSGLLALTSLLVTRFGNVPINQLIKNWSPDQLPVNWSATLHTWDNFNLIRTLAALGCFISFIAATLLFRCKT